MKIARNRFAGVLTMLALAACGGEQAPATPAAADNTPAAEAPTAPETPPATVAPPVAVVAAAPARLGPPGCGKPGTQLEDSRGPYAVADVAIGMTLQEAWDAIACRAKLKKNGPPGSAISTTANGPAGPVDVPTRRAEVITEGNGGPMTQEVFSIFLAGPKDAERVVMRFEWPRRRTAGDVLKHRRFDFEETAILEKTADFRKHQRAGDKQRGAVRVAHQIEVALAVFRFAVGKAVELVGHRAQGLG